MREVLENGCEIIQGYNVRVGLIRTDNEGEREAYLFWLEGQSIEAQHDWLWCTHEQAIRYINAWLENIGLALQDDNIVEF